MKFHYLLIKCIIIYSYNHNYYLINKSNIYKYLQNMKYYLLKLILINQVNFKHYYSIINLKNILLHINLFLKILYFN